MSQPTSRYTCACHPNEAAHDSVTAQASVGTSRRGFLSGLGALGALGAASVLPGCANVPGQTAKPHRIDIHHHIVPPSYANELKSVTGAGAPAWSVQASLEDMDKSGIATSVVALMQPGAYFKQAKGPELDRRMAREANEFAARMSQNHPGRFGSFATLPLMDTEGSLKEIEYAMDTLKADGIGLMTSYGTHYMGDKRFWPIWEELNRRKATIYTHPLMPDCCRNPIAGLPPSAIEFATDTTRTVASLVFSGAANKFPNITWIWSHSGGTMPFLWSRFTRQQVDMGDQAKAVVPNGVLYEVQRHFYDTAQGHHEGAIAALRTLIPTSQILFGSDFPYRTGEEVRQGLADRNFTRSELAAIERGNALRILPGLKTV